MRDDIFELAGVGVDYSTPSGTVTGLHDVTISLPASGLTVFAGPSGSGKSTLLRVLALFERPARGEIRFDGTDIGALGHAERRALRRDHLSLVFQNPTDNLLDHLTVADNLRAAAQSTRPPTCFSQRRRNPTPPTCFSQRRRNPTQSCRPNEILGKLGLGGTGSWHISALSGGQQQRLAFGCALARGSSVILADEPTSQLDEASADLVLDTLRQLVAEDFCVLVASHDDRLIELGSRVARLRGGLLEGAR